MVPEVEGTTKEKDEMALMSDNFEFKRVEPRDSFEKARYEVWLDGVLIGWAVRKSTSWERKTPGNRYVNARGRHDKWFAVRPDGMKLYSSHDIRRHVAVQLRWLEEEHRREEEK